MKLNCSFEKTAETGLTDFFSPALQRLEPLVSVTISTYNHHDWISQAISGVMAQKCSFPFEIIVSDDGSSDGTAEICKTYQQRYPDRIRLITSDKNRGSKANLYRLRKRVRGKLHAICEGDDFWVDPMKLKLQVMALIENPDCSIVFGRTENISLIDEKNIKTASHLPNEKTEYSILPPDVFLSRYKGHTSSILFRTITKLPDWYWNPSAFGDIWIHLLCMEKGNAIFFDRLFSIHRRTGKGIWTGLDRLTQCERTLENLKQMFKYSQKRNLPFKNIIEKRMLKAEIKLGKQFIVSHPLTKAAGYVFRTNRLRRIWKYPGLIPHLVKLNIRLILCALMPKK